MAKDHSPHGFDRENGYVSDLEKIEMEGDRVNASFGSNTMIPMFILI